MPTLTALLAQTTTTTSEVERVIGEPLDRWIVITAGLALLLVILVAGLVVRQRLARQG